MKMGNAEIMTDSDSEYGKERKKISNKEEESFGTMKSSAVE